MNWFQARAYLRYWRDAYTIYDMHSPFLYEFVQFVFDKERTYYDFRLLEKLREMMKKDKGRLTLSDKGAPTKLRKKHLSVKEILEHIASPQKISEQLYRMNIYNESHNSLELGTCLGLNSLYLAKSSSGKFLTIEGHEPFYQYARKFFSITNADEVIHLFGLFSEILPKLKNEKFDLIYLDGHHEYEASKEYIDQLYNMLNDKGMIVMADIHWSKGMEKAWQEIYQQDRFSLSMDCFHYGILWKKGYKGAKQHISYLPQAWTKPWKLHKAI